MISLSALAHASSSARHRRFCSFTAGEIKEQKRQRLAEDEAWARAEREITAYWNPVAPVTSFKYLGRVLLAEDNDWP